MHFKVSTSFFFLTQQQFSTFQCLKHREVFLSFNVKKKKNGINAFFDSITLEVRIIMESSDLYFSKLLGQYFSHLLLN